MMAADESLAEAMVRAALAAGDAILEVRASGRLGAAGKSDGSPVTRADLDAHYAILERLGDDAPGFAVVSEEAPAPPLAPGEPYFLVDPLDGTRNFIRGGSEFTVNIALLRGGVPVLGVVYAPVSRFCCWCDGTGRALGADVRAPETLDSGAWMDRDARPRSLVSSHYLDSATVRWLEERGIDCREPVVSSLKFALLATGRAALYPRFAPLWDWDTAAGHAVLAAAGGRVLDAGLSEQLRYGPPPWRIRGFVACARGFVP